MIRRALGYLKHRTRATEVSVTKSFTKLNRQVHQLTNTTKLNRYPKIFKACTEYSQRWEKPRVLSFGCSTGDECLTLQIYMPDAELLGTDIVRSNLRKAERKFAHTDIKFFHSTKENLVANGRYNIIFCMSVLCRWPDTQHTDDCTDIYPFERFEQMCQQLDKLVAVDGLLVIFNANFQFNDTSVFGNYDVLPVEGIADSGFVHHFNKNNKKIIGQTHKDCVFIKKSSY